MFRHLIAASIAIASSSTFAQSDDILREGTGPRRAALNELESKPLDSKVFAQITDYRNGEPLTQENTAGSVLLITTWASWHSASSRTLPQLQKLHERFERDGLTIVAVHDTRGWGERAERVAEREGVEFRYAVNKGGLDALLKIDNDPDFYLVDRAGQLRFADIPTGELEEAIGLLIGEDMADAATRNDRLAEEQEAARRAARYASNINQDLDLLNVPLDLPFIRPSVSAYEGLDWPEVLMRTGRNEVTVMPTWQAAVPSGMYFTRPAVTAGRVTVVYLWHPIFYTTYNEHMPMIDDTITTVFQRDVAVIGLLCGFNDQLRASDNNRDELPPQLLRMVEDSGYLESVVRGIVRKQTPKHSLMNDIDGAQLDALISGRDDNNSGGNDEIPLPYGFILSSDGFVRFYGFINDDFRAALRDIVELDPAVAARRQAERDYIERGRSAP